MIAQKMAEIWPIKYLNERYKSHYEDYEKQSKVFQQHRLK